MSKAKSKPAPRTPRPAPRAEKPPVVNAVVTKCPTCGSTERERYFHTVERAIAGVDRDGKHYTHVVWRRTRCANCGQIRIDRSYENRPPAKRRVA